MQCVRSAVVAGVFAVVVGGAPGAARADAWPVLGSAPRVDADGSKDAAVVIGIDQYAFVPHVEGASANARDWYTFLVEGEKVPIGRVHLLRDRDGTREQILAVAKKAAGEVQTGGRLWLVFIGHGAPAADGKDGVLVGVDAQQTVSGLYARSVAQRELLDAAAHGAQKSTLLVVDACFSGRTASGAPLAPGLQPLIRVKDAEAAKTGSSETAILSAGTNDQFAGPLPGLGRPAFSYLVLGALRGWGDKAGRGVVTAQDAVDYARLVMAVVPLGRTQTPEITSTNAKVVMSRGGHEQGPELSRIVVSEPKTAPVPTDKPAAPVVGGASRLRVRATCASSPKVLAGKEDLTVEEIGDNTDVVLKAASSMVASLRYDEASRERVMAEPGFVDFALPAGAHRLRVKARHCKQIEERVVLEPGTTTDFAPHLDEYLVPVVQVSFRRPAFAGLGDHLEVHGADGKTVCDDLPCTARVPVAEQTFQVTWVKAGGKSLTVFLPDAGDGAKDKDLAAEVSRTTSMGMLAPGVMIGGGVVSLIGLTMFANNQGADVQGVNHSGNRTVGVGIMLGGAAVVGLGGLMALLGVGEKERLSVTYEAASPQVKKKETGLDLRVVPGGVLGVF